MSILALRGQGRKGIKYLAFSVTTLTLAVFLTTMAFANLVLATSTLDVVSAVANRYFSNAYSDSDREDATGYGFPMVQGWGDYGGGEAGITLLGPVNPNEIQILLDYVDSMTQYTNLQTTPLKGCQVQEYTLHYGAGAGVILPDYLLTIEIYASGNSAATDIATGKKILQEVLDGLEKAGLLSQAAPDIVEEKPEKTDKKEEVPVTAGQSAIPLDEPTTVGDSMNISSVGNGPTAPTLLVIDRPHLVTEIMNYHWNHGQGASPGLISLIDQNGQTYGPWQAKGTDGQGGVPNANWHVYPNIVVPAGTYTITDSDHATWAQNASSGGRGMGYVKATPNFEAAGASSDSSGGYDSSESFPGGKLPDFCGCEGPAGVGHVGNIPGPRTNTEAVTGVVVPGAIATALGALAGLGGSGGFTPPPSGGAPLYPTGGSPAPGPLRGSEASRGAYGVAQGSINQIGRRRSEEIFIDTEEEMREVLVKPIGEIYGGPIDETGTFTSPVKDILIDTAEDMQEAFIQPPDAIYIDTKEIGTDLIIDDINPNSFVIAPERGESPEFILFSKPSEEVALDTTAFDDVEIKREADLAPDELSPYDQEGFDLNGYDRDGYNREGFDAKGFNREGFDKNGFDAQGFDKEGFDKNGFDARGFDKEGFDKAGFDSEGYNREGFDPKGFDREGFDKNGFDARGFDKEGFDKAGFDSEGYNREGFDPKGFDREGFDKNGFDAQGFDKEGFDKAGFDSEGYNREGFDPKGFDRESFDKNGFDAQGFDKEGFDKAGFDGEGFNREGFDAKGFDGEGYNREGFNAKGFDREGYGKNGFDSEGFDRDGYNIDGFNRQGYNRQGFDAKGFDKNGFDKNDFDAKGFDREGYDKNGFNSQGWDREGYDKNGYDPEGYNREGLDKNGQSREGYDADGYDKSGFNENGYDKDGFDRQGFNYEGYNRSGYDPWGYNRQGYDKEGYHWTGYNADGYDRIGRHWSDNPYEEGSLFNVDTRNPFDGGIVDLGGRREAWQPTKPALGEPYPRTLEKYGLKKWGDTIPNEPEIEIPPQVPESSGVIGPEDMPSSDIPEPSVAQGNLPLDGEKRTLVGATDGQTYEIEYDAKSGEWINTESGNIFRPDQFERWQSDLAEDQRRATEDLAKMAAREDATSKAIDASLDDWKTLEKMQKAAEKYGVGERGGPGDMDRAIQDLKDDMLSGRAVDTDRMEQLKKIINNRIEGKTASKYAAPKEESWVDTLGYGLEANMATAKEVITGEKSDGSTSYLGIGARIMMTAATGGTAGTIIDGTFTAAEAVFRMKDSIDNDESTFRTVSKAIGMVVLGEQVSRGVSFGGSALNKELIERFPVATNKAADWLETSLLKGSALNQRLSYKLGMIGKESAENSLDQINKRLIDIGQDKVAEGIIDTATKGYGLAVANTFEDVSKRVADGAADNIGRGVGRTAAGSVDDVASAATRRTAAGSADDIASAATRRTAAGSADDVASAATRRTAADTTDDIAKRTGASTELSSTKRVPRSADEVMADPGAVTRAQNQVRNNVNNYDNLPPARQQELVRQQAIYDEYKLQAQNRTADIADKVRRGEPLTVDEIMEMKADPASMRTLKNAHETGVGNRLASHEAEAVQVSFNEALDRQIHQPSYRSVQEHLHGRYADASPGDIRCRSVRTPGTQPSACNINTDNDVIAERLVQGPHGPEWVEIPKSEWEDVYHRAFAENSGFSPDNARGRFPDTNWGDMDQATQYETWAKLHEEAPMDQFDLSAGRDFSDQRTWHLEDGDLPGRPMVEATGEEIAQGVETVTIGGRQMRSSSGYELVQRGEGTLLDSEQLGLMETHKIDGYWNTKGTPQQVMRGQTEALEQMRKTGELAQTIETGYRDMGYKVADMPTSMQEAIRVINNNDLSPAARVARLQELGYDSPGDFVNKVTSRIGAIRNVPRN